MLEKLFNSWLLLKNNDLVSYTFEEYVYVFGSFNDNRLFNLIKKDLTKGVKDDK